MQVSTHLSEYNDTYNKLYSNTYDVFNKDKNGKPTDIHLLMSNTYIDFKNDMKCLYVPHNDLMKINKYGWFLTLSQKDLRECKNIICKIL